MAFPHTESLILAHETAALDLHKLVRQQEELSETDLRLIEQVRDALKAEQEAHAKTQADLEKATATLRKAQADLDEARKTIATMEAHPDVKAARAAQVEAERQQLLARLAALAPAV